MSEPYNVLLTVPVTQESILEVLEGADLYWPMAVEVDARTGFVKVGWWDDGEKWDPDLGRPIRPGDVFQITDTVSATFHGQGVHWKKLADALGLIARGDITNDDYQMRAALSILVNFEDSDWDAWTGEMMLQVALFGHLEFG